jgi:hypothetical protein
MGKRKENQNQLLGLVSHIKFPFVGTSCSSWAAGSGAVNIDGLLLSSIEIVAVVVVFLLIRDSVIMELANVMSTEPPGVVSTIALELVATSGGVLFTNRDADV